ncbi:MAG: hypothetical protein M1813_002257 [Trichoglossum hirsutum]|nr:MAG: hypothetical protein M1813_002257 [Trichoglossum hirsutum]
MSRSPDSRRSSAGSFSGMTNNLKAHFRATRARLLTNEFYMTPENKRAPLNQWWAELQALYQTPAYREREKRRIEYETRHREWAREEYKVKMWQLDLR